MSSSRVELVVAAMATVLLFTACSSTRAPAPRAVAATTPVPVAAPAPAAAPLAPPSMAVEPTAPAAPAVRPAPGPFTLAKAGLTAPTPRGWKTTRRNGELVYEGPMRVPSVAVFEAARPSLDDAVGALPNQIAGAVSGVRVTRAAQRTTVAGYDAYVVEGTGRAEGFPMRWRATVVEAERTTVLLALAPSMFWGSRQGAIRSFKQGVRRTDVQTASLPAREASMR
ncbi:MAG: hypothetical protein QNJ98_12315 [Planctomycetota bacterium]|nr:hypothetical protein [Planctomycetota bacterium]